MLETSLTRRAVSVAVANVLSKKGAREIPLWEKKKTKKRTAEEQEQKEENIKIIQNVDPSKNWVKKIYMANTRSR